MRIVVVLAIVGHFLRMFALAFVAPLAYAIIIGAWSSALDFSVGLAATLAFGFLFVRVDAEERRTLHRAEALAVVCATWFAIALFGAIPYVMAGMPFVDAFFESMSGFTTTGATVLTVFVGTYFAFGALLTLFGHDLVTSFSSAVATVGNIGPAFNDAGPMGSYAFFGDPEKIILALGMWIGRLEIVTVLALLHLDVLRDIHWRRFKG